MKTEKELKKISKNYERSSPNSTVAQAWLGGARWMKYQMESYAEQVAKEHLEQTLIDFTEHAKFADGFDRDIIKSFLNKQQP